MIDFGGIAILLLCIENETSPKCAGLNTLTGENCFITDLTIRNRKKYRNFYIFGCEWSRLSLIIWLGEKVGFTGSKKLIVETELVKFQRWKGARGKPPECPPPILSFASFLSKNWLEGIQKMNALQPFKNETGINIPFTPLYYMCCL